MTGQTFTHKKLVTFFSVGVVIFLLLLFGTLLTTLFIFLTSSLPDPKFGKPQEYKFYKFNPTTNKESNGRVRIPESLGPEDYISYSEDSGALMLISPFESHQFHCIGTCKCETSRRTTSVLSKTFSILIAAATSVLSLSIAQKKFQEECSKFSETELDCSPGEIITEIEQCEEKPSDDPLENVGKFKTFWCSGNCLPSSFFTLNERGFPFQESHGEDFCDKLITESEISVLITDTCLKTPDGLKKAADKKFIKSKLHPFCQDNSKVQYNYEWKHTVTGNLEERELTGHLCVSQDRFEGWVNPSVICLETLGIKGKTPL